MVFESDGEVEPVNHYQYGTNLFDATIQSELEFESVHKPENSNES